MFRLRKAAEVKPSLRILLNAMKQPFKRGYFVFHLNKFIFSLGRERNRLSPWNPYISPIAKRIFEYFTDSFCELCQKGIGSFDFFISVGVLLRFLFLLVCLFVCPFVTWLSTISGNRSRTYVLNF